MQFGWFADKQREPQHLTAELKDAVAETAADEEFFWRFRPRKHVLAQVGEAPTLWVDGMGLEWVSVILGYLKAKAPGVKANTLLSRANLPTITEANKEQIVEGDLVFHQLDQLAHSYDYSFPESLLRQIQCIYEVVGIALERLQTDKRVVITSDHGTSRFALHGTKYEVTDGVVPCRNGRYGEIAKDVYPVGPSDVPLIKEGAYLVSRGYGRFPCGGSSVGEVHGGATIEEAIVPVIVLEKTDSDSRIELNLLAETVRLDKAGVAFVELSVSRSATSVKAEIGSSEFPAEMTGPQKWKLRLSGLPAGHHEARIRVDGDYIGKVKFQLLASGIRENRFEL